MAVFEVYYRVEGTNHVIGELVTTSITTAQMVCADLVAEGKEAWVEQIQ